MANTETEYCNELPKICNINHGFAFINVEQLLISAYNKILTSNIANKKAHKFER